MKILTLSKLEKLKLAGLCIQAVTGVIGGSLILSEGYPYTTLAVLAIGALANQVVSFIKEKENLNIHEKPTDTPSNNTPTE